MLFHEVHDATDDCLLFLIASEGISIAVDVKSAGAGVVRGIAQIRCGFKAVILELLHTNQIEAFKIGSRWEIPKESVVKFLRFR